MFTRGAQFPAVKCVESPTRTSSGAGRIQKLTAGKWFEYAVLLERELLLIVGLDRNRRSGGNGTKESY